MKNNSMQHTIGMVGLGVMGENIVLNMSDHGYSVAGFDKDLSKVENLSKHSTDSTTDGTIVRKIYATTDIQKFIASLQTPRSILMLVPAGPAVDSVIQDLLPYLETGDLIIDAGNSYFKDTNKRAEALSAKGIQFMGVGVSGGEEGARRGPSLMPGGPKEAYERVRPILEAIAAKVQQEPCVTYIGPGSAGHFVKMVHNGIEYGLMQLIAETYDLMKQGLGLNNQQLSEVYAEWNTQALNSYLVEITSHIFAKTDDKTHKSLVDVILAESDQTGTGMWTSESGMELQIPIPTIDLAVAMRDLSVLTTQREQAYQLYKRPIKTLTLNKNEILSIIRDGLFAAMIITYSQGMALLAAASDKYNYQLDLQAIAKIWRGGCIIRAAVLEDFSEAFNAFTVSKDSSHLTNLLLSPKISALIMKHQESLRQIVCQAAESGIATPCLMTTLSYLDAYRSIWMPANLIQAQRDYFGSHGYRRTDNKGTFHTNWTST